jgi:hypothetical protein
MENGYEAGVVAAAIPNLAMAGLVVAYCAKSSCYVDWDEKVYRCQQDQLEIVHTPEIVGIRTLKAKVMTVIA